MAIVVTAYAGGSTAEEALAAGAWQVLPKPVDFPRLLGLVDEALGQPLVLVVDDDHDLCRTSGTCSASGATASAWPTTSRKRPSGSRIAASASC